MGKFWVNDELYDDGWLKKMSGNELKVLFAITRHFNRFGKCYPSIRKLATNTNLHHETIKQCLNKLELLGFLEQLEIKERCKLRYNFVRTARIFLPGNAKLLGNPDSKEDIKEVFKEGENNFNLNNPKNERTEEQKMRMTEKLNQLKNVLIEKHLYFAKK
ncbi:MAG: helix-turn-helix domain-containing protein [Candidatus Kapabacteria bacterium]|nr:helix-turn-helix domain-containing protein [Candidatus Kapabacteria bacterium]